MADKLDHIVLFSGDGDFRAVVDAVQRKGLRVSVVSTVRSQPPMVADELRRQADIFIELQSLQSQIQRAGGPSQGAPHDDDDDDYDDDYDDEGEAEVEVV